MQVLRNDDRFIWAGFVVIFVQDGDPIIQSDSGATIPKPSVVYDNIYEAAKNNGREYEWWAVT